MSNAVIHEWLAFFCGYVSYWNWTFYICALSCFKRYSQFVILYNTKRRAGRAGGPCFQINNMNFRRYGWLHRRPGWQPAQNARLAGCTTGRVSELHIKAGQWLRKSPPDCPFVQPAGPALCRMCTPPKFTFFIRKHSSPARPALQLVLSVIFC